jgi:hypothetical protein
VNVPVRLRVCVCVMASVWFACVVSRLKPFDFVMCVCVFATREVSFGFVCESVYFSIWGYRERSCSFVCVCVWDDFCLVCLCCFEAKAFRLCYVCVCLCKPMKIILLLKITNKEK